MLPRLFTLFTKPDQQILTEGGSREREGTTISPSLEEQLPQPSRPLSLHWTNHLSQDTGQGPPGNSPGPQDRVGSLGMQKQPPMCSPSSRG